MQSCACTAAGGGPWRRPSAGLGGASPTPAPLRLPKIHDRPDADSTGSAVAHRARHQKRAGWDPKLPTTDPAPGGDSPAPRPAGTSPAGDCCTPPPSRHSALRTPAQAGAETAGAAESTGAPHHAGPLHLHLRLRLFPSRPRRALPGPQEPRQRRAGRPRLTA
eukprot:scaffold7052_cov254-Pinguiococcus_pyrenoidosus.AAC.83